MKKKISILILAFAFAVILPETSFGQWDYGSSSIDNIISSRIDRRKTAARIRARKAANRKKVVRKKKVNRRNVRRTSLNENLIENQFRTDYILVKKVNIV